MVEEPIRICQFSELSNSVGFAKMEKNKEPTQIQSEMNSDQIHKSLCIRDPQIELDRNQQIVKTRVLLSRHSLYFLVFFKIPK